MKLQSKLPAAYADNGLCETAKRFIDEPEEPVVVVAVLKTRQTIQDIESNKIEPVVYIERIEPILNELDEFKALGCAQRAKDARTGETLPIDVGTGEVQVSTQDPIICNTDPWANTDI